MKVKLIDEHLYKERFLIENQINKPRHFRRVFPGFVESEKTILISSVLPVQSSGSESYVNNT